MNVLRALVALVKLGARVYRAVAPRPTRPVPPPRRTPEQVAIESRAWAMPPARKAAGK